MNKIESLLDAIASLKGWSNPDSLTYQIKNPLHIKSFARPGKHEIDEEGRRIFTSWLAGYKACLFDLDMKVSGKSRAGLKEGDKLSNLLRVYGLSESLGQDQVVKYLKRALKDQTINKETPLAYFREKDSK
jgi:hypothetical protein